MLVEWWICVKLSCVQTTTSIKHDTKKNNHIHQVQINQAVVTKKFTHIVKKPNKIKPERYSKSQIHNQLHYITLCIKYFD